MTKIYQLEKLKNSEKLTFNKVKTKKPTAISYSKKQFLLPKAEKSNSDRQEIVENRILAHKVKV